MEFEFDGEIVEWRGPAPFYFVPLPADVAAEIKLVEAQASYGWGCIPADVTIGDYAFYTALIPREGTYFLPLKVEVRKKAGLATEGSVAGSLTLRGA
jgi:hypothetical protein